MFPFQFRYTPPASAVGQTVTLTAEAVDKAGNKSTQDLHIRVVLGSTRRPTGAGAGHPPTLSGHADGRLDADLRQRRVPQRADTTTYAWLRNGVAIAGATAQTYMLTTADLGRDIACRYTANNATTRLGSTRSTRPTAVSGAGPAGPAGPGPRVRRSRRRDGRHGPAVRRAPPVHERDGCRRPAGPTGATGPAGPKGDKGEKGDTPNVRVTCDLSADGKSIICTISSDPADELEREGEAHGTGADRRQQEESRASPAREGHDDAALHQAPQEGAEGRLRITPARRHEQARSAAR